MTSLGTWVRQSHAQDLPTRAKYHIGVLIKLTASLGLWHTNLTINCKAILRQKLQQLQIYSRQHCYSGRAQLCDSIHMSQVHHFTKEDPFGKKERKKKAEEMTRKPATKWRIIRRLGKATDIFNKEP